jgi:translation initiation factor IF-1
MNKKEEIILDAVIVDRVDSLAFRAELKNGHDFIAFLFRDDRRLGNNLNPGCAVQVKMSPFDMSKGRIMNMANAVRYE